MWQGATKLGTMRAVDDPVATSLSKVNSAAFARLTEKLRLLNLKYELISRPKDSLRQRSGPELILHGDSLHSNACRINDETDEYGAIREARPDEKFANFVVSLPHDSRIAEAWHQCDDMEVTKIDIFQI